MTACLYQFKGIFNMGVNRMEVSSSHALPRFRMVLSLRKRADSFAVGKPVAAHVAVDGIQESITLLRHGVSPSCPFRVEPPGCPRGSPTDPDERN